MAYRLANITFVKVDEEGNEELNSKGKIISYVPKGRWKELEYLCEERDDDDFEEEKEQHYDRIPSNYISSGRNVFGLPPHHCLNLAS